MKLKSKPAVPSGAMRQVDKRPQVDRRGFLRGSGLAAVGVTVVPVGALAAAPPAAAGPEFETLGADVGRALVRMARDIFPHDRLADRYYVAAVAPYDAQASKEASLKRLLSDGVAELDALASQRHGKPYVDVATEPERVALLKAVEPGAFFQKVKGDLVTGIYNNKAVWQLFGYEGSSWEKGGYVNRGFDDIDWLT